MTSATTQETPLEGESLARRCAEICDENKAIDIQLFDVTGCSLLTDFFVLCSGNSEPHIRALAGHLQKELAEEGTQLAHVDGVAASRWIVLDYGTVLVHIFHPELRQYYEIEKLLGQERVIYSNKPE